MTFDGRYEIISAVETRKEHTMKINFITTKEEHDAVMKMLEAGEENDAPREGYIVIGKNVITAIDNTTGSAWTEDFSSIFAALNYVMDTQYDLSPYCSEMEFLRKFQYNG